MHSGAGKRGVTNDSTGERGILGRGAGKDDVINDNAGQKEKPRRVFSDFRIKVFMLLLISASFLIFYLNGAQYGT